MSTRFIALSATFLLGLCSLNTQALPSDPFPTAASDAPGQLDQQTVEGRVQRMLTNPYGEVDGLRLDDGTIARFPPHLADALTALVKIGDTVRIVGQPELKGAIRGQAIIHVDSGRILYEQPPADEKRRPLPPHLRAQRLQPQEVEGLVETVLTGTRGETNGVILSDGTIVRFPPDSLRLSVQSGAPFAASGLGTHNEFGTSLEAISMGTTLSALQPLYHPEPTATGVEDQ